MYKRQTLGWSDYTNNVIGLADQILPQFPATEQGQLDFLLKLKTIVTATPRGKGIAYWGGEFIAFKGSMSTNAVSYTHLDVYKRQLILLSAASFPRYEKPNFFANINKLSPCT